MQCATHPDVETELSCGKCGKPICPRCMVHTPVGARCRDCAQLRRLPTYHTPAPVLARGAAASLAAGATLGVGWWFFLAFSFGFLSLIVGLAVGYGVAQAVLWATNRRAGPPLQAIAIAGVILAYFVRLGLILTADVDIAIVRFDIFGVLAAAIGCFVAAGQLR